MWEIEMKGFFVFLLLIAVAIAILIYLDKQETAQPMPAPPTSQQTLPAAPLSSQPDPMGRYTTPAPLTGEALEQWKQQRRGNSTSGGGSASASSAPASLKDAARKAGVTITQYQPSGRDATVRVDWTGSNAARGGDFLDAALRSGAIRDFDMIDKGGAMTPGKTSWFAVYRLKM